MKFKLSISFAFLLVVLIACKRDISGIAEFSKVDSSLAYIKIIDVAPNFRTIYGGRDSVNVFANDVKINATALSFNSIYPFAVNSTTNSITATYAAVQPGEQKFRLSVPGVINPDSLTVHTFTKTLKAGKFYSLFITDSLKFTPDSAQIVQDGFSPITTGYINLRFAHKVLNDTAGKTVDVFSYARNATIFTNIKPGTVTGFAMLSNNIAVPDTFYVTRSLPTGAPASTPLTQRIVLAKIAANAAALGSGATDQRSFTLYFKGDANLTTGTKARSLGVYLNK